MNFLTFKTICFSWNAIEKREWILLSVINIFGTIFGFSAHSYTHFTLCQFLMTLFLQILINFWRLFIINFIWIHTIIWRVLLIQFSWFCRQNLKIFSLIICRLWLTDINFVFILSIFLIIRWFKHTIGLLSIFSWSLLSSQKTCFKILVNRIFIFFALWLIVRTFWETILIGLFYLLSLSWVNKFGEW